MQLMRMIKLSGVFDAFPLNFAKLEVQKDRNRLAYMHLMNKYSNHGLGHVENFSATLT